ncbi:MAG: thiolase family protein [Armatimonadetes bacterium]|nr:thiolase family protein [Armatimonadota bacterium]
MHLVPEEEVLICSAARTPIGRFDGNLAEYTAVDLGAVAVAAAVQRAGVDPARVEAVTLGNVVHAGLGMGPAKAAAVKAGLPETVVARCVDTVCSSALEAVCLTVEAMVAGSLRVAVAGGMESRSQAPYLLGPKFIRNAGAFAKGKRARMKRAGAYRWALEGDELDQLKALEIKDSVSYDGLFWPADRKFMREYALLFAKKHGYTVEQINRYAEESHRKARLAIENGWFAEEIAPCGEVAVDQLVPDEKLAAMREECAENPAGSYNASVPADGAAAVLLATGDAAKELGLTPLARVMAFSRAHCAAPEFLAAPVTAAEEIAAALRAAGQPADFPIIEANEAFGIQLPFFEASFPGAAINVHGGAVALGHPLGAAGARLLTTLLYAMKRHQHPRGLVTLCFGGGGAVAIAVEKA